MIDQQRWDTIREIFDAALELPTSERDAFIQSASHGDGEICAEVGLLLRAESDAGDFLEAPIAPGSLAGTALAGAAGQPPLQPGDVLCNRFRILRLVGEGGMGHVFEAWDTELNRPVALKAIRPEIASHPESLKRFRREVSLALSITHPNVCRTFDLERDQRVVDAAKGTVADIVFLTMEFLDGETLAARIAHGGPLPLNEALRIAGQIADALVSAHAMGILHRDIKPANVMLVQPVTTASAPAHSVASGLMRRAVITDFGLARQDALFQATEQSAISRSGFPAGTLAYMAPEQLEAGATSAATDIYAFGLVLFEMVSGRRAFASSSPLSGIRQRLAGPPPSPQSLVPGLPEPWYRAIEGCLRTHPADRYQSAADVIAVLNGGHIVLPAVRSGATGLQDVVLQLVRAPQAAWSRLSRGRQFVTAIILLMLMSLSFEVVRLVEVSGLSDKASKVQPGALVYLTRVKNETGEKALDNLTELLEAGLTQSAQINLLDQGRVGDTLQNMTKPADSAIDEATAREIALRTNAVRVIFCKVTGKPGNYQLHVDIQRPDSNILTRYRNRNMENFSWQSASATSSSAIPADLLSAVRDAAGWIRVKVGESQNDIGRFDAPLEDVTTGSWQALAEYKQAMVLRRKQETTEAIYALQKAVAVDPDFSLAYARIGDFQVALGQHLLGYRSYQKALEVGQLRRLTRRERDRIQGMFALDTGDYQQAEVAFRDYASTYPNDYLGWFYRGYPLMMLGRTEEAIATLNHAYQIDPSQPSTLTQLGIFLASLGHFAEARQLSEQLQASDHSIQAQYVLGLVAFLDQHYEDASAQFMKIGKSSQASYAPWSLALQARVAAERGDFPRAITFLEEGIKKDAALGDNAGRSRKWLDEAYILFHTGQLEECTNKLDLTSSVDHSPQNLELTAALLEQLAEVDPGHEKRYHDRLSKIELNALNDDFGLVSTTAKIRIHGYLLLATHQWEKALSDFRKARVFDAPIAPSEPLAHALILGALHVHDSETQKAMTAEAMSLYADTAKHPGNIWQRPMDFPPGFLANQLETYISLAEKQDLHARGLNDARQLLLHLRPESLRGQSFVH